jgi:phosphohistidine phosphatase SixA
VGITHYPSAVPAYLVRHANAKGNQQSAGLADLLRDAEITRVVSSPAARCVETVAPLAEARHLTVETDRRLAEGGGAQECIDALLNGRSEGTVLCSHGDLIPKVIRRLVTAGMRTTDPNLSQKGSVWELEVVDGRVISGRYHAP